VQATPQQSPVEDIPPADRIRGRLADLFSEVALLRALLRLAERRDRLKSRRQQKGGADAA
jgi:hypothetical protein